MRHRAKPKHLSAKLRSVRKHLGLSQSQVAARLSFDVENGRISDYELGKRTPNVLLLLDYASPRWNPH